MDLKELGEAMSQALALRGMIDALDERISAFDSQIKNNQTEISRLKSLESVTAKAISDKDAVVAERSQRQSELDKRLAVLDEVGAKLPIAQKFGTKQVSL